MLLTTAEMAFTRSQSLGLVGEASEAGIRKALARLVDQGIVLEERIGSRYIYRANRDHLLWPSVEALFRAQDLLTDRIRAAVAQWDIPAVSVQLFGSVAQGSAGEDSDIDLLVVCPELSEDELDVWERQVGSLRDDVVRWTGNPCDVVVLGPDGLAGAVGQEAGTLPSPRVHVAGIDPTLA